MRNDGLGARRSKPAYQDLINYSWLSNVYRKTTLSCSFSGFNNENLDSKRLCCGQKAKQKHCS
jgi:hypothetical protein